MEYTQAILYTFIYIIGQNGNTDMLYLFAAIALLFYAWRRHNKVVLIIKVNLPFVIICLVILYPNTEPIRVFVFLGKMILNITYMLYVAYNSRKWKFIKFVKSDSNYTCITNRTFLNVAWLKAIDKWSLLDRAENISRLKLYYSNTGALSFACGIILILLVYQLITEKVDCHQVIGIVVVLLDIYLSYGMVGLTCVLTAVMVMLCSLCI